MKIDIIRSIIISVLLIIIWGCSGNPMVESVSPKNNIQPEYQFAYIEIENQEFEDVFVRLRLPDANIIRLGWFGSYETRAWLVRITKSGWAYFGVKVIEQTLERGLRSQSRDIVRCGGQIWLEPGLVRRYKLNKPIGRSTHCLGMGY